VWTFFANFRETPECTDTAHEGDENDNLISLGTFFRTDYNDPASVDLTPLMANIVTLTQNQDLEIYFIFSNEWWDQFLRYSVSEDVILTGTQVEQSKDRWVAKNAKYPKGNLNPDTGVPTAKGGRFLQCLDSELGSIQGLAPRKGPPDVLDVFTPHFDKDGGHGIVFPQRAWISYRAKFAAGYPRRLRYHTYENGAWTVKYTSPGPPPSDASAPFIEFLENEGVRIIMKNVLAYIAAHELLGHCLDLKREVTIEGKGKSAVNLSYHWGEGTGSELDVRPVHEIDRKPAKYNNFLVPKHFQNFDKIDMRLSETQPTD
jgi:hypothetical protein